MSIISWLKNILAEEPVLISYLANGGLAAVLAFLFHLGSVQEASAAVIVTGLVTIYTALKTVPPSVSLITGAVTTMATAAAAFGLHLTSNETSVLVALVTAVVPLLIRVHVSPKRKIITPAFIAK